MYCRGVKDFGHAVVLAFGVVINFFRNYITNRLGNHEGEMYYELSGKVGFPFFGELILECIHRTEKAMTQAHVFKAAELCLQAQSQAIVVN